MGSFRTTQAKPRRFWKCTKSVFVSFCKERWLILECNLLIPGKLDQTPQRSWCCKLVLILNKEHNITFSIHLFIHNSGSRFSCLFPMPKILGPRFVLHRCPKTDSLLGLSNFERVVYLTPVKCSECQKAFEEHQIKSSGIRTKGKILTSCFWSWWLEIGEVMIIRTDLSVIDSAQRNVSYNAN